VTRQSRIDPTVALLVILTGMMTLVILAVIYIVAFADPDPAAAYLPPGAELVAQPDGPPTCDASSLETMSCPSGYYCNIDTCVKIERDPECGEGESCRECDCRSGLVCHHNTCMDPKMVEEVPLICQEDENLSKAVKRLVALCKTRKADPGKIVSTASCSIEEWEELALKDKDFDLMLAAFPNRFAVHFPLGRPSAAARDWPRPAHREFVLDKLHAYQQVLREAKQLFVIGRASPDGDPKTNHLLALARMNLVSDLIDKVVHEGKSATERAQRPIHSRSFTLPTSRPIRPEKYDEVYLKNPPGSQALGLEPLIAWDAKSLKDLRDKLDDEDLLREIGSPEYAKLLNEINRVVLVIPIPCTGDEYEQRRNDLDRAAAAAAAGAAP
jgi:hypothetical protein